MNPEIVSNVISFVSALATVAAAVFAALELRRSRKANENREVRERKEATINAYNILQNEVLDKLVSIKPQEVIDVVENIDCDEYRNIYSDYRALIARCEHFAVGINENIYDFEVLYELSGEHLIYLYKKVEPIILHSRKNRCKNIPFSDFEEMVIKLEKRANNKEK
jgi:hypothetical protein